jgi:hypothetical protein
MYWIDKDAKESRRKERVKKILDVTNRVSIRFQSLGVKRKSVIVAAADLGDIYQYADDVLQLIDLVLETPPNELDKLETIFVSLRVILGELKDHAAHARIPLEYLADFCDSHKSVETQKQDIV